MGVSQEKYPNQEIPAPIKILLWIFTPRTPGIADLGEGPAAHSERASQADLPRGAKAVGRAERARICCAEDQALPEKGAHLDMCLCHRCSFDVQWRQLRPIVRQT